MKPGEDDHLRRGAEPEKQAVLLIKLRPAPMFARRPKRLALFEALMRRVGRNVLEGEFQRRGQHLRIPAGEDIMIGRYGASVGKILTGKAGAYNVALVKVLYNKSQIDRSFLYLWLQSSTFQRALSAVSRSAQDGFNKGDLEGIGFPLVTLARQRREATRAVAALSEIDRLTHEATSARRLLDRLDEGVLSKAFRGELLPQDPADEPASELLKRIRSDRAGTTKARRGRAQAA